MRDTIVARVPAAVTSWIIDVFEKEIPWVANRVFLLATSIVHSIMCPALIGDNNKVRTQAQLLLLPLFCPELFRCGNMKLLLKLILVIIGVYSAANLLTLNQAACDHPYAGSSSAGTAPSTETLFKQKCAKCHGADGSGDTSMGRIFNAPDFTDSRWWARHPNTAERVRVITKGKKNMPAFGKKLAGAQIAGLATYVERFKH